MSADANGKHRVNALSHTQRDPSAAGPSTGKPMSTATAAAAAATTTRAPSSTPFSRRRWTAAENGALVEAMCGKGSTTLTWSAATFTPAFFDKMVRRIARDKGHLLKGRSSGALASQARRLGGLAGATGSSSNNANGGEDDELGLVGPSRATPRPLMPFADVARGSAVKSSPSSASRSLVRDDRPASSPYPGLRWRPDPGPSRSPTRPRSRSRSPLGRYSASYGHDRADGRTSSSSTSSAAYQSRRSMHGYDTFARRPPLQSSWRRDGDGVRHHSLDGRHNDTPRRGPSYHLQTRLSEQSRPYSRSFSTQSAREDAYRQTARRERTPSPARRKRRRSISTDGDAKDRPGSSSAAVPPSRTLFRTSPGTEASSSGSPAPVTRKDSTTTTTTTATATASPEKEPLSASQQAFRQSFWGLQSREEHAPGDDPAGQVDF